MKPGRLLLWLFLVVLVAGTVTGTALMLRNDNGKINWKTHYETETEAKVIVPATEASALQDKKQTETVIEPKVQGKVPTPDIDEQLLTKNEYSRPGKKIKKVNYLVIHYLGNPGTTAQENRDYFESLKDLKNATMSSNYIIGLDGEIIQCVPDDEMAYASNNANKESISIENCNIDITGKFLKDTYISLVKLTAYLAEKYDLDRDHIIRHHDVTGKDCPLYYVENEEAWEVFLDDVMFYIELCHQKSPELKNIENVLDGLEYTYDSKFDGSIVLEGKKKDDKEAGRPHDAGETTETEEEKKESAPVEEKHEERYEEEQHDDDHRDDTYYPEDDYYVDYDSSYDNNNYDNSYDNNYYDDGSGYDYNYDNDSQQQYEPDGNYDNGVVSDDSDVEEGMYDDGVVEMDE